MTFELRRATIDDLTDIQKMFVATINQVCAKDYTAAQLNLWTSGADNGDRWTSKLTSQYFLVATAERQIVGFASLENNDNVDLMYVHKDYQRQGIADLLLTALETEAIRNGTKTLKSDVSKTAKSFFEKKGFATITAQNRIIELVEIINYRMEKVL
jgi:putative acetyltransferase